MKKKILIYCEGITDQIFIANFLEKVYQAEVQQNTMFNDKNKLDIIFTLKHYEGKVIDIGGCSKLNNQEFILTNMVDNTELGGINIVIFDADYTGNENGNKGFHPCSQKLNNIKQSKNVDFQYFIWPNNQDDGEIENLLRLIVHPDNESLFKCFEGHLECLRQLNRETEIEIPTLKHMLNFYMSSLRMETKLKHKSYKNDSFWNWNLEKPSPLYKLRTFFNEVLNI